MASYTDINGNHWEIVVTVGGLKEVRRRIHDETGVGLKLTATGKNTLLEVAKDPVLLADVLWCLCEDSARARNIDQKTHQSGLHGEVFAVAASALAEAFEDFYPQADHDERSPTWEALHKRAGRTLKKGKFTSENRPEEEDEAKKSEKQVSKKDKKAKRMPEAEKEEAK